MNLRGDIQSRDGAGHGKNSLVDTGRRGEGGGRGKTGESKEELHGGAEMFVLVDGGKSRHKNEVDAYVLRRTCRLYVCTKNSAWRQVRVGSWETCGSGGSGVGSRGSGLGEVAVTIHEFHEMSSVCHITRMSHH